MKSNPKGIEAARRSEANAMIRAGETPANLDRLLKQLNFTAEGVAEAALEGASLFEEAARYRVGKMRLRSSAEMRFDKVKAEAELRIRREGAEAGDKITEGHVKAKLAIDDNVIAAQVHYNDSEADEEYARLLLEAYRIRRDSLKAIVDLTGAERAMQQIVNANQSQLQKTREKLADKYPGRPQA